MKRFTFVLFFSLSTIVNASGSSGLDQHLEKDLLSTVLLRVEGISEIYNHGGGRSQDGSMVTHRIHFSAMLESDDYSQLRETVFEEIIEEIERRGFHVRGQGARNRPASGTFRYFWESGAGTVSMILFLPNDPEDRSGQIFVQDEDAEGVFIPESGSPQIAFFITEFEFGSSFSEVILSPIREPGEGENE